GRLSERDEVGAHLIRRLPQEFEAQGAQPRLARELARLQRQAGFDLPKDERQAERARPPLDRTRIAARSRAARSVIEVRDRKLKAERFRQLAQSDQERE